MPIDQGPIDQRAGFRYLAPPETLSGVPSDCPWHMRPRVRSGRMWRRVYRHCVARAAVAVELFPVRFSHSWQEGVLPASTVVSVCRHARCVGLHIRVTREIRGVCDLEKAQGKLTAALFQSLLA